ncbi:MAG: hypothetical protein HY364_01740 [Candidatus Aenigmarchaeota archaeon]|nr:hypothetical protein [Candidatus Aenigmarchaeota archaeon]
MRSNITPPLPAMRNPGFADYAALIRPEICALTAGAVYTSAMVSGGTNPANAVTFAALSALLICAGIMSLLRYFSQEQDGILPHTALAASITFFVAATLSAFPLGANMALISIAAFLFSLIYFWKLRRVTLLGNLAFAALVVGPFIFGALLSVNPLPGLFLASFLFLAAAGADIYNGVAAMMNGKNTTSIAEKYGVNRARTIAAAFLLLAIAISFVPFGIGIEGYIYVFFALAADMLLLMAISFHKNAVIITAFSAVLMAIAFGAAGVA